MKEHDAQPAPTPETPSLPWDQNAIAQALGTSDRPTIDAALGRDLRYDLADTRLELYPGAGVLRVATPESQLTMATPSAPRVGEVEILFANDTPAREVWCAISERGRVVFSYGKHVPEAPESPLEPTSPPERFATRRGRRRGLQLDNIALVLASLLPCKQEWQAVANRMPTGSVLLCSTSTNQRQQRILQQVSAHMKRKGHRVISLPAERFV